jgi:hypothetical protein
MLKEIEQQIATLAGKAVPDANLAVSLRQFVAEDVFQREQQSVVDAILGRMRVLPVAFHVRIVVRVPASNGARATLLEHVARIAHVLGDPEVRNGRTFTGGSTSGFVVDTFALAKAAINDVASDDVFAAELRYRGTGSIWPPDLTLEPLGRIQDSKIEAVTQ